MIKHYCDRCGNEVIEYFGEANIHISTDNPFVKNRRHRFTLCEDCRVSLIKLIEGWKKNAVQT